MTPAGEQTWYRNNNQGGGGIYRKVYGNKKKPWGKGALCRGEQRKKETALSQKRRGNLWKKL